MFAMSDEWNDDRARLLQSARERHGWSRQRLAAEAGVSERTIVDLENNRRAGSEEGVNPRRSTVLAVVRAVGDRELAAQVGIEPEAPPGGETDDEIMRVLIKHLTPAVRELRELFARRDEF